VLKSLGKWLKIYEDEISLFLWVLLILFLIRTSSILFNNFAETAFLKRYGVEYLPVVNVANSISTFFVMAFLTGLMAKIPGSRMLSYFLLFCGTSVALLRFVVPLGFTIIYPVLYILKAQYEVLLALMFWNLANDLFNTRQSKRLFPLITAGGVVGGIIGSFATPPLARAITMDNLMFVYLITTSTGAFVVNRMGARFPTLLLSHKKEKKAKKRSSIVKEFRNILPLIKESTLVKILILLTLLPNIIIPILNYQFAYTVNQSFATQGGMLSFFGYFRGFMNIVSLIILLFVGRVYGRWGLPIVLMFHPFNYMLVFLAFLLKFDIFSAIYARVSTNVIRTTMNNPARAVLMGLFPLEYRAMIRPFLRGTVVRIGILLGAGIIMASEGLFSPRYLSIAAMVFVGGWIVTSLVLKKSYSQILLDLISRNMLDLKSLEEKDVGSVFADKQIQSGLVKTFLSSRGEDCLWHARILKSQGVEDLDSHILAVLRQNDDRTRIELLSMLSPDAGEETVGVFRELAATENRDLTVALVTAANRLPARISYDFCKEIFEASEDPEVKAYAVTGLYKRAPDEYREIIDSWLKSHEVSLKKAGVIAAGETGDRAYISPLKEILEQEEDHSILPHILTALNRLKVSDPNSLVTPYLAHPSEPVRLAALEAFEIEDGDTVRTVIRLMDDASEKVCRLAQEKLQASSYQDAKVLVESLNIPRRKVREGIFALLESLDIKDLDIFRFARSQVERCYRYVAQVEGLRLLPESQERDLIIDHLENKKQVELENIVRVLATEDRTGQMRIIWRGLFSTDPRRRSNSLEALDDAMDSTLSRIMLPLLEGIPAAEVLKVGIKNFKLPDFTSERGAVCTHLLDEDDWVTVVLTLFLIIAQGPEKIHAHMEKVRTLTVSENRFIQQMASSAMDTDGHGPEKMEEGMETEISIPDKILRLKGINIFEGLAVGELAAIASVTEEVDYPAGETVIREGESGDTMFLIIKGEVSVIKGGGEEGRREIELARIGTGDYFGEMALFEDAVRSATIRTAQEARFLVLHKQEFTEIVREYPQIALHICRALSSRIRELHAKIKS